MQQHKGALIRKAQAARTAGYEAVARTGFRGALYWERWLLTKEPGQSEEARVVSALELSREAGDWKEGDLVLVHVDRSPVLQRLPFVEHWRALVAENLPEQVAHEQELETAFQEFKRQPSEETVLKVRETADRIAEIGSPIAVHTILARVDAELGALEDAEEHLTALLVCRPLWVPYAVQLAEHQSRRDIKRAFATIEAGRHLFGPNFWLPL
ncbi:Hypothetical protein CAP_1558 [Chondromyces apiculatus DSM 436]|uniref:Uncharacterized protein n=1 Tax=Chondromyces apiculatus DSM 436 TaxID=1192034 RepID=A0A017TE12_9BACT|nr:Hypothetical protein CAP_1558 [Chondromyces apiculatus DSM 436]